MAIELSIYWPMLFLTLEKLHIVFLMSLGIKFYL